jgi:hypothetical protein
MLTITSEQVSSNCCCSSNGQAGQHQLQANSFGWYKSVSSTGSVVGGSSSTRRSRSLSQAAVVPASWQQSLFADS